jgi:AAA15 family ATPase/GTPase
MCTENCNRLSDCCENCYQDFLKWKKLKNNSSFDFKKSLLNLGFDSELVDEWMLIRKIKKAINTEISFKKFVSQVELAPEDKNDVLRFIVEKQWKGFQYEWLLKEQIEFKKIVQNGTGQRQQLFGRQTADDVRKNLSGWDGFN